MIERFEKFSYTVTEIVNQLHKIAAEEMRRYGLKWPHAVYLISMYRHPEGITAAGLAELCGRDKADVSRAVAVMAEKGLVKKESNGQNYRVLLKLTEDGIKAAAHISERAKLAVEYVSGGVTDEQRNNFYEVLDVIGANLQKMSENGLPE
jgi:DNA-binding MarR family transcriptional regulator